MDQELPAGQWKRRGLLGWFIGLGLLVPVYVILSLFDNTTELTPNHDKALIDCFAIAGLWGLASGVLAVRQSREATLGQRVALALALPLLGFLSVSLVGMRTANIVEGLIDFPASKTTTFQSLVLISRAYHTGGKGRSWYVQTTPIWSNLEITEDDYEFMLTHRRVGDAGHDPGEISSKGYFCAQVTMQQSGNALRILHAGSQKLPKDSVMICPPNDGTGKQGRIP